MAIPTRIDNGGVLITATNYYSGGATNYIVETPSGVIYRFYIDSLVYSNDPVFSKSTNYGLTWSDPTQLKAITCTQLAVWYDRWTDPTGVLGDLIHVVYTDSSADDVFYRTIDTASSDTLGTERTVFLGVSTAAGGAVSVSRMRGGNVIVAGSIDAGAEIYAKKTANLGVNWTDISNPYEASPDKLIMMPGWGADNQDAMCFYYDNSGTEVSVKYYDDSADSWSEASIATSVTIPDHTTTTLGHWSAAVDHTNSANLVAFWAAVDTSGADLRVFSCTQTTQTETAANCVLNSTDDQGFCVISILGTLWYVFYCGKSDGTETYNTTMTINYKYSSDGGANWSSEIQLSNLLFQIVVFIGCPISYKTLNVLSATPSNLSVNSNLAIPRATYQLGM